MNKSILNSSSLKVKKKKLGPSTVPHPMHSSSPNIIKFKLFPAALSLRCYRSTFNRQSLSAIRVYQQNNPMALSFLYFDDCRTLGNVEHDHMANENDQLDVLPFPFSRLCFEMTKSSLVVCKIIDHSSEDVFSRPFG